MESSFFENFIDSDQVRRNKLGQTIYYVAFSLFIVISFLEFSTFSSFVSMHTLNRLTYARCYYLIQLSGKFGCVTQFCLDWL